jgi:hypothetical protein
VTVRKSFLPSRVVKHPKSKITTEELLRGMGPTFYKMLMEEGLWPLWIKEYYNPHTKQCDVYFVGHRAAYYTDPEATYNLNDFEITYFKEVNKFR